MAAAPVKSPLHNFPSTLLKWNTKKDSSQSPQRCPTPPTQPQPEPEPTKPVGSRSSRNRRPVPAPPVEAENHNECVGEAMEVERQWNLRPRRAAASASVAVGTGAEKAGEGVGKVVKGENAVGASGTGKSGCGKSRGNKFWISLSKDEIEEDVFAMTGQKPSRRPKKRSKAVQRQLDCTFPGLWLVGMTPESYRSLDTPPKK